jgi:hypothetical protein
MEAVAIPDHARNKISQTEELNENKNFDKNKDHNVGQNDVPDQNEDSDKNDVTDQNEDQENVADQNEGKPEKKLIIEEFKTLPLDCLYTVADSFLDEHGLVQHHIASANNFYTKGVQQIISQGFKIGREMQNVRTTTDEDKSIASISCNVNFTNVTISKPQSINTTTRYETILMPNEALKLERNYGGNLTVSFTVEAIATIAETGQTIKRTETVQDYRIAKIPIVKGSVLCHTDGMTKETLYELGEAVDDPMDI